MHVRRVRSNWLPECTEQCLPLFYQTEWPIWARLGVCWSARCTLVSMKNVPLQYVMYVNLVYYVNTHSQTLIYLYVSMCSILLQSKYL